MKANEKKLVRFLGDPDTNFVIPVYQRNYDWKKEQCKQLYDDLINVASGEQKSHFFGTIVSVYNDNNNSSNREYLIIDGQQRVTTVSLLLIAIYNILKKNLLEEEGVIKEKLINLYLINQYCDEDRKLKLKPIKDDREAFEKLFEDDDLVAGSNMTSNYNYFYNRILEEEVPLKDLVNAIENLVIVEIELKNGEDDPQLIFESLNSTGLELTDADKVRNFILMGKEFDVQENLYNKYWHKVEKNTNYRVTEFIRDYMTIKQGKISKINKIYFSFKEYINKNNIVVDECLEDMLKFSKYYSNIIKNDLDLKEANEIIARINKLEVTVSYPFLLMLLDDYNGGIISDCELVEALSVIESYVFRRIVCKSPTNALNKIFMNLGKEIKKYPDYKNNYVYRLKLILKNKKASQKMPNDEEFKRSFFENDFYNTKAKNKIYLLERVENFNNNEKVDVENLVSENTLTIEHIMPQTLTEHWKKSLGENFEEIYTKYINTIGNLTLTGYNSKMSNKTFIEKRDMEKGFNESRLKLNKYLSSIDTWTEAEILQRAQILFNDALNIWKYPDVKDEEGEVVDNEFSLADEDDFTNTRIKSYSFKGESVKVPNWTRLYQDVCFKLYNLEPEKFSRLANKKFDEEHISKRFSTNRTNLRESYKIADNLYIEKNLSTDTKLATLKIIFDECNIDYNELVFTIN